MPMTIALIIHKSYLFHSGSCIDFSFLLKYAVSNSY